MPQTPAKVFGGDRVDRVTIRFPKTIHNEKKTPSGTLITQALAAHEPNSKATPSKLTGVTNELAQSQDTRQDFSIEYAPKKTQTTYVNKSLSESPQQPQTDDSGLFHNDKAMFHVSYTNPEGIKREICMDMDIKSRLEELYVNDDDSFQQMLTNYLIRKYEEVSHISFPYIGPPKFYELCRIVAHVTHELFADAINFSGILESFCSSDVCDEAFGSVGTWKDMETRIRGGAGIPPFSSKITDDIISSCNHHVRQDKPYCRFFILPFNEDGSFYVRKRHGDNLGEVLVVLEPKSLNFRHQREFFEAENCSVLKNWLPNCQTAVVVWINDSYRTTFPPPIDIEECFVAWALDTVGKSSVIQFDALRRAFPLSCRNGDEKANELLF